MDARIPRKEIFKWLVSFGIYQPKVLIDLSGLEPQKEKKYTGRMIALPRGYGKTSEIIKEISSLGKERSLVIVANSQRAQAFKSVTKNFDLEGPIRITTVNEFLSGRVNPMDRNSKVYIDDVEDILSYLFGQVELFTTSRKNIEK